MFFFMCVRSSQKFHKTMLDSVMSASMRFFDLNPLGRIMNRFSTDIGVVDDIIPITMFDFLHVVIHFKIFFQQYEEVSNAHFFFSRSQ